MNLDPEYVGPPPVGRGGRQWPSLQHRLEPLRATPGVWARLEMPTVAAARSAASNLTTGRIPRPPGRWEVVSREIDRTGWLYARYLGDEI